MTKMIKNIEKIRHSLAHILALAVQEWDPKVKFGIGPITENGFYYDFLLSKKISQDVLLKLENRMRELIKKNLKFQKQELSFKKAEEIFKNQKQDFKLELLEDLKNYGTTDWELIQKIKNKKAKRRKVSKVTIYRVGEFVDLCQGPHVRSTKEIKPEIFKLIQISGAYWRGDEKNPMLTRISGVAFKTEKELKEYLKLQEELKLRDHRKLGEELELFTFSKDVGPGLVLWLPYGTVIREELEKLAKEVEREWGYLRVATPHIGKRKLFEISGHIPYYQESMYPPMELDDGQYFLKAMNCPFHHAIYLSKKRSYRDLPLRLAEFGTVYRYELSGTLAGLLRVRGFTQNDAHIYCTKEQVVEEFISVMKMHQYYYQQIFKIKDFYMRLSLPDLTDKTKYVPDKKGWQEAVKLIKQAMKESGLPYAEAEGEAAYYGPKIDFQIKSVIGKEETASTNQLDFMSAKRFNLTYTDRNGKEKYVYVIHRAPLGSHERFIAFLIEHYAGAFPLWLAPIQIVILPVKEENENYAEKVAKELFENFRVEFWPAKETLSKRILLAERKKIPYIGVIGPVEEKENSIRVRQRNNRDLGSFSLAHFKELLIQKIQNREDE